ncbi:hypothetical protein GCM10009550_75110 [Actinocorallia libanotica]|uniref:HTH gntR-type domain-containing protein n=2 Tax=Actinocorallia libanotica TaxID=46162 RepID=A0ABN1S0U5_9ACTN
MNMKVSEEGSADPRPLHQRIAADLREEILSGELLPGSTLPSTQQLRERFGVANATIQKALQVLKDEGMLLGRAGANVSVREHRQRTIQPAITIVPAPPGQPYVWLTKVPRPGESGAIELLEVAEVQPPGEVAGALGLPDGGTAVRRSQLLRINGEPAELVTSYYPIELARGTAMMENRKIKGGTPRLLKDMGYPPRKSVDLVSARVPTQEQYRRLELPSDLPVLRTFRVVYSDDERPIEATVMVKASHLYELQYELTGETESA